MTRLQDGIEVLRAKRDHELSLNELIGDRTVADVFGYYTKENGEPTFKLTRVALSDGTTIDVEGEHDFPYLADYIGEVSLPKESR